MDLNQATVEVADFDAALEFYQTLGLKLIVFSEGRYARFEMPAGASTISIHIAEEPQVSGPLLYAEVDDVDAVYSDLKAKGIVFDTVPEDQPWLWREVRFRDPSGNRWCLFHAGNNRRFPPWRVEA